MRRISQVLVAGVVGALVVVGPAGAGLNPPLVIDPEEGPPGTIISTGGNCLEDFIPSQGKFALPDSWAIEVTLTGDGVDESVETTSEPEADWQADITVPDDATPGDILDVGATCTPVYVTSAPISNQALGFPYEPAEFLVTQPPTTTTEAPTTTTEATTTTAAAPAVAAQPAFTG